MALFGRKIEPQAEAPPAAVEATQPSVADIVAQVLQQVLPLTQPAAVQPAQSAELEEEQATPEEIARMTRVAQQVMSGHAAIFERAMPSIVRQNVVNGLTEGQRIIYERYKAEVDAGVTRACANNPALQAVAEIHENAIALTIGRHADEIEKVVLERARPEDLPPTFSMPSAQSSPGSAVIEATDEEKDWVAYFAPRSRQRSWDVETMRKFKQIKPGSMQDMIDQYKAMQEEEKKSG